MNVALKLSNPLDPSKNVETTALVDTGATFTIVPRQVFENLQLTVTGKRKVRTASNMETLEESFVAVEIKGDQTVTLILISNTLEKILIGVITLESLALTVNPTTGKLEEAETYLLRAQD